MSDNSKNGKVYLVGAGPGDAGLITVKGLELLKRAEVVVFDYLVNPRLLKYCQGAQTIYVGKQAGRHAMPQEQINQLLIAKAREGLRVVRLKGGDPFVFGRGGEEALALAEAGIAFEVVPGVTAAIAAAAYAGIPVTHRDINSSVTLVTGHEKEGDGEGEAGSSDIDWGALARMPCIAFYMGVKSLAAICARLTEHGMTPDMPAACIEWGTTTRQRTVEGTLATLPALAEQAGISPPALTIIGRVVELRRRLSWFERLPLFGRTIVVTRSREQAGELGSALEELGARVIEAPTIELRAPASWKYVDEALACLSSFDWVVFTSVNGVKAARDRLFATGRDARSFGTARVAAIGQATAEAVGRLLCLKVDICPERFSGESLADELIATGRVAGRKFLLLRADIGSVVLNHKLQEAGAIVHDVAIYETRPAGSLPDGLKEMLAAGKIDWVTFTSSSTARYLADLLGSDYRQSLSRTKLASIGPVTSGTLRELGLEVAAEARVSTIAGLVEAMVKCAS